MYSRKRQMKLFRHPSWSGGPVILTNTFSESEAFIIKYDAAGTPQWGRRVGGLNSTDTATSVSTDVSGNVYITGTYTAAGIRVYNSDDTIFTTMPHDGSIHTFIVKYNQGGTPQWARRVGGNSVSATGITTDLSGNVYITGNFSGRPILYNADHLTFAAAPASLFTMTGASSEYTDSNAAFILKYDTAGTPQWGRQMGGGAFELSYAIFTDSSGSVYASGFSTASTLRFYGALASTQISANFVGHRDGFIVKYNTEGVPQYVRRIGGINFDDSILSISIDPNDNIYVCGETDCTSITIFNTDNTTTFQTVNMGSFSRAGFVVKYNNTGTPQWARKMTAPSRQVRAIGISTDSLGNAYVVGTYDTSTVTIFDSDNSSTFATLTNSGSLDTFVVKYDTTGTPQWARKIGGSGFQQATGISTDSNGNVYVTGQYTFATNVFGEDNVSVFAALTLSGESDSFVVKYNTTGTPQWARKIGGAQSDRTLAISTQSNGTTYVVGAYSSVLLTVSVQG